ncbi:hypothetical protein JCM14469_32750 [Desulfatiferula olefinivorans]
MKKLFLGKDGEKDICLSLNTLQRHFACFGSSGSGKTVACKVLIEELARGGVPVIAFDPQGDIASLVELEDPEEPARHQVPPEIRDSYAQNTEVVIWTPGSSKGLPLCINPLQFDGMDELDAEDQVRFLSATAKNLTGLIGFDLDSDDGKAAESVLSVVFEYCIRTNIGLRDFNSLIALLADLPESVSQQIAAVSSDKLMKDISKKLSILTMGSRKLIFETGTPANIDTLLGLDRPTGKTRISVIYLNTLHTQEEKEFFVAGITQMLYRWMLKHPLSGGQDGVQCALYIDEIAPYIPPVRKPSCKDSLSLLFKQARKYGVACVIATQNPGDIDYKAIAQFSTYNLGCLSTKQDIKKVKTRLDSIAPAQSDDIVTTLPSLKKGHFLILSPDEFDTARNLMVRWLVTRHTVLGEDQLADLVPDDLRETYARKPPAAEAESLDTFPATGSDQPEGSLTPPADQPGADEVYYVKNQVFESDLEKLVKPLLSGALFKSEKLEGYTFQYRPLIRVNLLFFKEKGLFRKTTSEIPENLYLDYKTHTIFHVDGKQSRFSPVVDADPHEIPDLDDHCAIDIIKKSEIDFDFRKIGKKLDPTEIRHLMERKYRVEVRDVDLLLYPTWACTIADKKTGKTRAIILDGTTGRPIAES